MESLPLFSRWFFFSSSLEGCQLCYLHISGRQTKQTHPPLIFVNGDQPSVGTAEDAAQVLGVPSAISLKSHPEMGVQSTFLFLFTLVFQEKDFYHFPLCLGSEPSTLHVLNSHSIPPSKARTVQSHSYKDCHSLL